MLKLLFPVFDEIHQTYSLGVFSLATEEKPPRDLNGLASACPVVFATEQSAVVEKHYMRSNFFGLSPYGYKIWEERINAFRVIASVDSFEFSVRESEKISQGHDYEIISVQERSVMTCAYIGMSAAETAHSLHRSVATVNAHRRSVARKLNCALSPIVIARVIYAHKAIQEMCNLEPQIGLGKHYRISDHSTHSDLLRAIS